MHARPRRPPCQGGLWPTAWGQPNRASRRALRGGKVGRGRRSGGGDRDRLQGRPQQLHEGPRGATTAKENLAG
eukprot:621859-Lingulodinium_polyedra.AAC.1